MDFTTIIMLLIPVVVARRQHRTLLETILKSKGNLYSKVNDDVQNVINNLFDSLNLTASFITKSRIKLLLTMHYDLKSIAEKNFDVHDKMKVEAKPKDANQNAKKIELFQLVEEILDNKPFNVSAKLYSRKRTKEKMTTTTPTTTTHANESDSEFADTREFMEFIQDFIKKVDNLSEKDFFKKPSVRPDDEDDFSEPNLPVWQPPSILELDFVNDTNSRRIFMGKRTRIRSYPFMVSVHLMGTFTCAGSIISQDLVITAASCLQLLYNNRFYRENPRSLAVRIGSDFFARGGEKIEIIETYFHPSYDPKTLANNLVILRLLKHIRFRKAQRKVKRIEYDRRKSNLPINSHGVLIVGWGARKQSQIIDQFQKMMVAQLDYYDKDECAEIYSKLYVTDKHFCAGFYSSGSGACNKDLGGPGIVSGVLVGIVSFGSPICGTGNSPTVFTKLGFYTKWIDSIVKMPSTVIGVQTTLAKIRLQTPVLHTREMNSPVTPVVETSANSIALQPAGNEDIITIHNVLNELAKANTTFLREVLYGDPEEAENIFDMSKPTAKSTYFNPPFMNKRTPHAIRTTPWNQFDYVSMPLTTKMFTVAPVLTTTTAALTISPISESTTTKAPVTDFSTVKTVARVSPFGMYNTSNYDVRLGNNNPENNIDNKPDDVPDDDRIDTDNDPGTDLKGYDGSSEEKLPPTVAMEEGLNYDHQVERQGPENQEEYYNSGINKNEEYYEERNYFNMNLNS